MNTILALIASVVATCGFNGFGEGSYGVSHDCPIFIEKLHYVLYPDLLCDKRGRHDHETIFGYIPVKRRSISPHFFNETDNTNYDNFRHSTTKFCYDTYFLKIAIIKLNKYHEIEITAYEMIVRLIASFVEHTKYPENYKGAISGMSCYFKDLKKSGYDVFCGLLSRKATRTVALEALYELLSFYKKRIPFSTNSDNDGDVDTISHYYASYLFGATAELISKASSIKSIYEAPDRKIVSKSFVMISNKFTNNTGSLVIDAETFVNKKKVNQ